MSEQGIQYLIHREIDKTKWDACINKAGNGLIYGYSFYLDHMSRNWDAIVLNNYEAVMPLIWNKKYGIKYCYQPPFIQQLGLFGNINEDSLQDLFKNLKSFVRYGDWMFNYHNKFINSHFPVSEMINLLINLEDGYEDIRSKYNKDLLDNLKKTEKQQFIYDTGNDIDSTIDLYRFHYANRTPHVKVKDYENFKSICKSPAQNCTCIIREVKNERDNLLASALLLKDQRRIYNMMNTTTEAGRKTEANHFLLDNIIREFSGQQLFFDFEGSDISGIKKFYEKFGAFYQPYYHWHFNKLPFYMKWLKR